MLPLFSEQVPLLVTIFSRNLSAMKKNLYTGQFNIYLINGNTDLINSVRIQYLIKYISIWDEVSMCKSLDVYKVSYQPDA